MTIVIIYVVYCFSSYRTISTSGISTVVIIYVVYCFSSYFATFVTSSVLTVVIVYVFAYFGLSATNCLVNNFHSGNLYLLTVGAVLNRVKYYGSTAYCGTNIAYIGSSVFTYAKECISSSLCCNVNRN